MEKRTSLFENGLIWFGAGVSIAEILTGTYFAALGFGRGLAAILVGHVIGCIMLFLAGVIGGKTRKSAMETVKDSFGSHGGQLFAILNVLQLVGWTAIMIYDGALAAEGIFTVGHWVWCLVIGALIIVWILIGITNLGKVNTVAMAALFILTLILFKIIFFDGTVVTSITDETFSFGAAVELAVADIEDVACVSQLQAAESDDVDLREVYVELVYPVCVVHSFAAVDRQVEVAFYVDVIQPLMFPEAAVRIQVRRGILQQAAVYAQRGYSRIAIHFWLYAKIEGQEHCVGNGLRLFSVIYFIQYSLCRVFCR